MGRTNVGPRRHRRDVRGDRDQEPRGCRTRAARADVDHHRRFGRDHPGVDVTRGLDQATRGAKCQHDQGRACGIRAIDGLNNVLSRHRMDEGVHLRRVDDWRRGWRRRSLLPRGLATEQQRCKPGADETNMEPCAPHVHRDLDGGDRFRIPASGVGFWGASPQTPPRTRVQRPNL